MMQQLIGGIVQFLIFCAVVAQLVNWIRTTFFPPDVDRKNFNAPQPRAQRQQPRRQGQPDANDSSEFLPEMRQQGAQRPAAMISNPANTARNPKSARPPRNQQSASRNQSVKASGKSSSKSAASGRSPGSGVGAHVDSYIGQHVKSHIGNQLADSVKNDISDQVRTHLGEDKNKPSAPTAATTHGSAAAGDLLLALRSPQGVRQAILMSEILSKPKSLRKS